MLLDGVMVSKRYGALPKSWGQFADKVKLVNYSHDGTLGEATPIRVLH